MKDPVFLGMGWQAPPATPMGTPDDKAISNVLYPIFENLPLSSQLSAQAVSNVQRFENKSLYTKGIFHSLLSFRLTQENIPTLYPAFPLGTPVAQYDTVPLAFTKQTVGNIITRGEFVLILGSDFDGSSDIDLVYWLTAPGRRTAPAAPLT